MVGIIQEQHPSRARLFMQWKQMDWPVLVDALDLLEVAVVPITLLIDEHGVIRRRVSPRSDVAEVMESFLSGTYEAPPAVVRPERVGAGVVEAPGDGATAESWRRHAESLLLWGGPARLDAAIDAFHRAVEADPEDAWAEFRLGVAYRLRYDSPGGSASNFASAVEHWARSRTLDPNNYIWRRRLQQFGPRLDKPYPFYDWVAQAREEVRARGEEPSRLPVEPRGAELTLPASEFENAAAGTGPDPEGKIHRDGGQFVQVTSTVVPHTGQAAGTARVHLEFRPNPANDAHWNNEVDGLVVWIDPPQGWAVDRRKMSLTNPPSEASEESRHVEFEIRRTAESTKSAEAGVSGYALYYVCEGARGSCLYRRQDVSVSLPPAGPAAAR